MNSAQIINQQDTSLDDILKKSVDNLATIRASARIEGWNINDKL